MSKYRLKNKFKVPQSELRGLFLEMVRNMNTNSVFDVKNLCRTLSPYCVTSNAKGSYFGIGPRYKGHSGISGRLLGYCSAKKEFELSLRILSHKQYIHITMYVTSHKHFLNKLIKHSIL